MHKARSFEIEAAVSACSRFLKKNTEPYLTEFGPPGGGGGEREIIKLVRTEKLLP